MFEGWISTVRSPTRIIALASLQLLAFLAAAETPDLNLLKARRYAMRFATGLGPTEVIYRAEGGAGIWAWDASTLEWARLHPLVYGERGLGTGGAITAKEDTVVVQGSTFLEFDAGTNRFLRRYAALPSLPEWAFHGEYVGRRTADELGLDPGYYGFVYCAQNPGSSSPRCGPSALPGQPAATDATVENHFYRRGLGAEGDLTLLKVLPTGPVGPTAAEARAVTLDPTRRRFWTMHHFPRSQPPGPQVTPRFEFGYFPIINGQIGQEVVLETEDQFWRSGGYDLLYDALDDALIGLGWLDRSVSQRPADLSQPETVIDTGAGSHNPLSMTMLAPGLPANYEQVLSAIGNGPGAHGTYWRSDVWILNPSTEPTTFSLRRVAQPGITREFTLAPHASLELKDILQTLGGGPATIGGDGTVTDALVITSPYRWGAQLTVYSRNYTAASAGSYGQAIPAVPTRIGYSTHLPDAGFLQETHSYAPEFVLDLREAGRFRHNLGVVNDTAEPLVIDLYYGYALAVPAEDAPTRRVAIPPHTVANMNVEDLVGAEILAQRAPILKIAGSRPAPIWLSMIDNKTGDATFLPFASFSLLGALDSTMAIPQIAHTPGANGTFWRSDLYGFFDTPVTHEQLAKAQFYPGDPAQCGGNTRVDTVLAGPIGAPGEAAINHEGSTTRRIFPDLVGQISGCASGTMGALELNIGSWLTGFTRTYTTRTDGGTYGDILPFYPAGGWPVQHFTGLTINNAYRINLGLYNGMDYAVTHRLLIYDDAGNEVRREEVTIGPRRSVQAPVATFVGELPQGLHSMTVLPLDKEGEPGRSWAYVAIVDNATGDTTNLW